MKQTSQRHFKITMIVWILGTLGLVGSNLEETIAFAQLSFSGANNLLPNSPMQIAQAEPTPSTPPSQPASRDITTAQPTPPEATDQHNRSTGTTSPPPIEQPSPPTEPSPTAQPKPTPLPSPATIDTLYQRATTLYQLRDYAGAIALYRQIIRQQPNHLNARISLGNALDDQGNYQDAIAVYQQALKLSPPSPSHALIHYNLGITYYRRQDFKKAVKALEQAITLRRNFPQAYEILGQIWEELGNLSAARRIYEQLIQVDARSAHAHWRLGIILGRQNRRSDAIKVLQRAKQLYTAAGNPTMATQVEQLLQRLGK